jgi:hypothetical protein
MAAPDGASQDLAGCGALEPVALDWLRVDDLNMCPADLVRVTYQISFGSCEPPPPPLVTFDAATNGYTVTQQVCSHLCQGAHHEGNYTIFLSEVARPAAGTVTVKDGAPGATASLLLPLQMERPAGQCGAIGELSCRSDAECIQRDPATRCWYDGGQCERICFGDPDCPPAAPRCTLGFCG